jgi:hypothetical protein
VTITASAAAGTFWPGLRLVVLDTETTETPDGTPRRCVSVGAVTCRHGTVRSRWQRLVDPGIPIDPISHSIHHISNDHLAQPGPISVGPGQAVIDVHAVGGDAERGQRVALRGEVLVVGGDPGVPDLECHAAQCAG